MKDFNATNLLVHEVKNYTLRTIGEKVSFSTLITTWDTVVDHTIIGIRNTVREYFLENEVDK